MNGKKNEEMREEESRFLLYEVDYFQGIYVHQ